MSTYRPHFGKPLEREAFLSHVKWDEKLITMLYLISYVINNGNCFYLKKYLTY